MKHYIFLIIMFAVIIISAPALVVWGLISDNKKPALPENIAVYLTEEKRIEIIPYRDYITGCVFGTIPPNSEKEAIKAAACACSTLALYQLENTDRTSLFGADVSDNPSEYQPYIQPEQLEQDYGESYARYLARVEECVDAALDCVITYKGELIFPAICSISTGLTDSAEEVFGEPLEYLQPVSCECDRSSRDYIATAALSTDYVRRQLMKYSENVQLPPNAAEWFTEPEYLPGGTLVKIKFGSAELTGRQLRDALSLRSSAIGVEYSEDMLVFTAKGCGNNVGMSIYCANQLALNGEKMTDILLHFYTGAELSPVEAPKA